MTISRVHSYLVHPHNDETKPSEIGGLEVPLTGRLFDMLSHLDYGAEKECDIDITFRPKDDGTQQNDCRDLLLTYLGKPSVATGLAVATRLQEATTKRSGLSLLFLVAGKNQHGLRLLISRFPAENGVMAEEHGKSLDVTFVEKVFMKNARAYKSVLFQCSSIAAGFWNGVAVDRQIDDERATADYWIRNFLLSDLTNTAAQGTKRMALAFQKAIRTASDVHVKHELVSAAQLLRGRKGKTSSAAKIVNDLSLSTDASAAVESSFARPELYNASFKFDLAEYDSMLLFRSVELDNGVMLTAENTTFDDVVHNEPAGRGGTKRRFTTEGNVIGEKLKKSR